VGEYLNWLSDTTFRFNRYATYAVMEENSKGCAMCLFKTDKASLLGGVATKPEFRGQGIAGALVTFLANKEKKNGNRVELLCKADSIVEFYKSIGFYVTNEWSLIDEL
ncbi:MAG: GNAT family N-acetyltransferase, partial [Ruminococcus sp.]|nr:GNAT family N-acetyltransferase [Candidatus Copronaster equi]